ncbi:hypothetical protein KI387_019412, partial [Taxus chinensis]
VVGQEIEFDSLHWFSTATQYLKNQISQLEGGIDASQLWGGLSGFQRWNQVNPPISNEAQN